MEINRYEELAKEIFLASLEVYKIMGSGLLESVYEMCLLRELQLRNISAECQVTISLQYKGFNLSKEYKIDILVEKQIIIELKSVDSILPVHEAQLISYLKLADKRMGFLINFNVPLIKSGFRRFVNNY
ncbi:MAG TPA: GxxExxY protein [Flavobacterium sp.]|jgi:GxxExxY protein|uniref:GxxExxY protein n=1 Tax=Flavobacterium sp. TaxID=239 RepID=UPI001B439DDE|nr:GxxExxY protein [Flavobacterium sp.]MBP6146296.1 GxxExxY protein [Flavobacterium sp.]MBP7182266.1 GxxExxY protein [Flavobacterium sp.]MBP7318805.1 GxxExxY protein [Flavobacterium sp.]MBP8886250.1 GxxExxY protein [Flavobacterium sp.]HRL72226.1 GxxExxY protein [Flavobacterium sp.]